MPTQTPSLPMSPASPWEPTVDEIRADLAHARAIVESFKRNLLAWSSSDQPGTSTPGASTLADADPAMIGGFGV